MPEGPFNAEKFVQQELGGTFKGVNEDGSIQVGVFDPELGEEVEKPFKLNEFLANEFGVNPAETEIIYNSPATALEENAVGFGLGTKMTLAKNDEDRLRLLQSEYGEENVLLDGADGFKVKDGKVWKRADTSFMQNIAANSPAIAAGIAGTKLGASAGAFLGPLGAVAGGILGGAVGAGVAKLAQIKDAELMGIRTEADAKEVSMEVGREVANALVWDTALLGMGKVAKGISSKGAKEVYDKFIDKVGISHTLENLLPGTSKTDWQTVLRSTDDAKQVIKDINENIRYEQKAARQVMTGKADPSTEKMARLISGLMKSFKNKAMKQYDTSMDYLEKEGVFANAKVEIEPIMNSLKGSLKELGLVDETGQFLTKKAAFESDQIQQVFSGKSRRTLKEVYEQINAASRRSGQLDFKSARSLIKGVDDILESSGFHNGGDMAISNTARRTLKQVRADMKNAIAQSLDDKPVRAMDGSGRMVKASQLFSEAQNKYSDFRSAYDDFAMESAFGGNKIQIRNTVNRMIGENGAALEDTFGKMAKSVGGSGENILRRLQQLRAGKNLSAPYAPGTTGWGTVIKSATPVIGSPRKASNFINNQMQRMSSMEAAKNTKLGMATFTGLQAMGKFSTYLNNLPHSERLTLMSSPELYRPMVESVFGAAPMSEQINQSLIQPAIGAVSGQ